MAGNYLSNPNPQFLDSSGDPVSGGAVEFFEAGGTTTDQDTFTDKDLTPGNENANPVVLDSDGRAPFAIFLQQLSYNVRLLTAPGGSVIWARDNVSNITQIDVTGTASVDTYAALTALLKATLIDGTFRQVNGRTARGDIEPVLFEFDSSSSATVNTGTILATDEGGTGRWLMRFDGPILVGWFNAFPDGSTDISTETNTALQAAKTLGGYIVRQPANTNKYFYGSATIVIPSQCELQGDGVEKTVLEFNSTSAIGIQLGESTAAENSMKARGFTVLNAAATAGTSVGLKVTDNSRNSVFVEDVQIGEFSGEQFGTGFSLGISCLQFTATRMKVFHCTNSFEIKQGNNIVDFYNCWFKSNNGAAATAGTVDAVSGLTNSSINFYTCGFEAHGLNGITVDGGTGTIHDINWFGCYFEANGNYHVKFTNTPGGNFHGGFFQMNSVMTTGVEYNTASRGTLIGCSPNNIASGGFFLKALAGNRVFAYYINDIQDSGREFDETAGAANSVGIVYADTSDIGTITKAIRHDDGTQILQIDMTNAAADDGNIKVVQPTNRGFRLPGFLRIPDGITSPAAAVVGEAFLFVDAADGDFKILFGDGTTKIIVTDT